MDRSAPWPGGVRSTLCRYGPDSHLLPTEETNAGPDAQQGGHAFECRINVEICLVFDDPVLAFRHAVATGCASIVGPSAKPHGQTTGFVGDPWGTLIEIASPLI